MSSIIYFLIWCSPIIIFAFIALICKLLKKNKDKSNSDKIDYEDFDCCVEDAEIVVDNTTEEFDDLSDINKVVRSKIYSHIFDTGFYWEAPYLIDVEKYKKVIGNDSRMTAKNTSTVKFSCEMWKSSSGDMNYTFYAFTNNNTADYEWHYDCCLFLDGECTFDEFKSFIKKITECIIGIDKQAVTKIINKRTKEIDKLKSLNLELVLIENEEN